ncbi:MAG: hypothetical protein DHS20C18_35520 [Saprospiraceae bacterium]|nr:MAG: hypothetical protein DHS20C18_35520 [Saprospiraceae bacterium]
MAKNKFHLFYVIILFSSVVLLVILFVDFKLIKPVILLSFAGAGAIAFLFGLIAVFTAGLGLTPNYTPVSTASLESGRYESKGASVFGVGLKVIGYALPFIILSSYLVVKNRYDDQVETANKIVEKIKNCTVLGINKGDNNVYTLAIECEGENMPKFFKESNQFKKVNSMLPLRDIVIEKFLEKTENKKLTDLETLRTGDKIAYLLFDRKGSSKRELIVKIE